MQSRVGVGHHAQGVGHAEDGAGHRRRPATSSGQLAGERPDGEEGGGPGDQGHGQVQRLTDREADRRGPAGEDRAGCSEYQQGDQAATEAGHGLGRGAPSGGLSDQQ